uniref:Protein kinase domain-containing protein n=1 Tax=Romanomermis culicivorax TaxID=13658 RepID=A0A915IXG1_ROMCU
MHGENFPGGPRTGHRRDGDVDSWVSAIRSLADGTVGEMNMCDEEAMEINGEEYASSAAYNERMKKKDEVAHTLTENRVLQKTRHPFLTTLKCLVLDDSDYGRSVDWWGTAFSLFVALCVTHLKFRLGGGPDDAKEIMTHPFFAPIDWLALYEKR